MFSSKIDEIREGVGLTTQALADKAGISRQAIFKARQDEGISECRLSTLGRIANALEVPVKELFDGEYEPGREKS